MAETKRSYGRWVVCTQDCDLNKAPMTSIDPVVELRAVHDVLVQFDDTQEPVHVALFAVVTDDAEEDAVRQWLAESVLALSEAVVDQIEVGTRDQVSLGFLESSFSADLSQLTWKGEVPTGV